MRTRLRDRSRAAGKRVHGIAAKLGSRSQLGRDQVKDSVQRIHRQARRPGPGRRARRATRVDPCPASAAPSTGQGSKAGQGGGARSGRGTAARAAGLRRQRPVRPAASHRQSSPGRPGNGAPGPPTPPGATVAELVGQVSARDHGHARVLLRCSYLCGGIAIRDPSSCSTRARPWTVLPLLRADDCDLRHITK